MGVDHVDLNHRTGGPRSSAPYPLTIERQLCAQVRAGQQDGALHLLPGLVDGIVSSAGGDPNEIKVRAADFKAVLSRAALEGGASTDSITNRSCSAALRLEAVATLAELQDWLRRIVVDYATEVTGRPPRDRRLIDKAISFIRGNFAEDLTLQRVSEAVHVSPYYLSHLFRRQCGCTFLECLTRSRVDAAKPLLEQQSMSITEIGSRVGYQDPNYFAQVFKRIEGITPSEFRRNRIALPLVGRPQEDERSVKAS